MNALYHPFLIASKKLLAKELFQIHAIKGELNNYQTFNCPKQKYVTLKTSLNYPMKFKKTVKEITKILKTFMHQLFDATFMSKKEYFDPISETFRVKSKFPHFLHFSSFN